MTRLGGIFLAAALGAAAFGARADFSAADALVSAPVEVRGPLSASKVADLVEYAREGMFAHTEKNAVGAEARILSLDSVSAVMQTGPGRILSLNLLPLKNDTVIALIETLTSQQPDSRLTIYSRDWTPRPKLWSEPRPSEWGRVAPLPVLLVGYDYSPADGILTLTNNSEESAKMLQRMRYQWTPKGFKRIKE